MKFLMSFYFEHKTAILIACILLSTIILTRVIRWLIDKSFVTASEKLKFDKTRYRFFKNAVSLIIWLIAIGAILSLTPKLKALAYTLFASAGILVAIIGFAAQAAFANIISGVFIVIFKPFRVGDLIKVGALEYGVVEDITLRHTIINNFENKRIIIPNSIISAENIINDNIQDSKVCRYVEIGISYDSDIDLALKILQEEGEKHPDSIDVRTLEQKEKGERKVNARLISFGDYSINLRAYVWANDPQAVFQMHSDINRAIKKRFDKEGIEIPFPYRTIVYKNDLPSNAKPQDDE